MIGPQAPVSLLPLLEPIVGFSLALSLAYLALPRFRYRQEISLFVSEAMGDLKGAPPLIQEIDTFRAVSRLANLPRQSSSDNSEKNAQNPLHGPWSFFYKYLFENNLDIVITSISSILGACLLAGGVIHGTRASNTLSGYFFENNIGFWITIVIVQQCLPALFVGLGKWVVSCAKGFAISKITDLKTIEKDKASAVTAPKKPPKNGKPTIPKISVLG
jgi:hypothetical protein